MRGVILVGSMRRLDAVPARAGGSLFTNLDEAFHERAGLRQELRDHSLVTSTKSPIHNVGMVKHAR
jgi:hypothetical protein